MSTLKINRPFAGLFVFLFLCVALHASETIDLSGQWQFQLDPQNQGVISDFVTQPFTDSIALPGSTSQAKKGNPLALEPVLPPSGPEKLDLKHGLTFGRDKNILETSTLAHLQQRFSYIGPAWYRRTFEIPENWTNQEVQLVLERVMWQSQVWINSQSVGARNSLTTPHRYDLTTALKPGRNEIVIRIDNRRQLEIGNPHAYTEESQTIWNGIIGRIALEAHDKLRIDHLDLRPSLTPRGVNITAQIHNDLDHEATANLHFQATPDNFKGDAQPAITIQATLPVGDSEQKLFCPMQTNTESWSELTPDLYRLQASLDTGNSHSKSSATFGLREFKTSGCSFTINGQPTFLRGSVNCCEFPKTGYPDMTGEEWNKIFYIVKSYGLNHVRFHTWCPPEVAFSIADRLGIYLEVELPNWCFKMGQDTNVTEFFQSEGERMIREYGNHPSWVMLTMGNELKGNYGTLDELKTYFRKLDPDLLYDSTTYPSSSRGKTPEPEDDYYISQDTKLGRARGQDIFEETQPGTETNFEHAVSCIDVPFISHEVGQYCVYPHLHEITKYDSVLRAVNFEAIRDDLKTKGRLDEAPTYTHDSGKLAAILYKEEIERALRTPNQAGFQLLQLNDFPGQGTSTVGLLDAFWDSKSLITPEIFREFCGPIVPLLLMPKRVYQNDETFDATVEVANFGPTPLEDQAIKWKISNGDNEIGHGAIKAQLIALGHGIKLGRIRQPLDSLTKATELKVTVELPGTPCINEWSIWVYPATPTSASSNNIAIFTNPTSSFYQALADGKRVLLLPSRASVSAPLAGAFTPSFWNPVMFPNQPGSMGAMIDARHPVFAEFPTDPWTNWQWWELLHNSFAINLDSLPQKPGMPCRFVDKFDRNALPAAIFDVRVGPGRLLVCTLDISSKLDQRIVARQLRRSIMDFMASYHFQPNCRLDPAQLKQLFTAPVDKSEP